LKNANDGSSKFDEKSDEWIFLRYSTASNAYIIFNKNTQNVEELMLVMFQEVDQHQQDHTQLEESKLVSN